PTETKREFLNIEEVNKLLKTECEVPIIKVAFLFSVLTGLRWSDIQNLKWKDLQHSEKNGYSLSFRQKKTKNIELHPIMDQSVQLIGEPQDGYYAHTDPPIPYQ
ncbi:MAG: hypothetical protein M3Q56_11385, partial [Bacteroidota bacterium]|nr:hypothetical protein [Bacteroidota bacterium]